MNPLMFHGYRVVANPMITKTETREVKRTWKERLFTLPWRPLKVTRTESYRVPSREVIVDKTNNVIYAHPEIVKEIQTVMEQEYNRVNSVDINFFAPAPFKNPFYGKPDWFRGGV